MTLVEVAARLLIFAAVPAAISFPLLYAVGSPWRSTPEGKMMMNLGSAIALVFTLIVVNVILGPYYPGREWVRLFTYAYLAFALWRLVFTLLRVQRRARTGWYDRHPVTGSAR